MSKSKISSEYPRPAEANLYLKTPLDFLMVCGGDYLEATILHMLDTAIRSNKTPEVEMSAEFIQNRLFGISSIKTVRRKLASLSKKGLLLSTSTDGGCLFHRVLYEKLDAECSKFYRILVDEKDKNLIVDYSHILSSMPYGCGQNVHGGMDKMSSNNNIYKNNTNIYINTNMSEFTEPKGIEVLKQSGEPMALEEVQAVLRVYHNGGSKFKHDQYKKSVSNLTERFGTKLEEIIKTYGQDKTIEGIRAFLEDEYWRKNGLPIPAFLKSPFKWIPGADDLNEPGQAGGPRVAARYGKRLTALPASSNERETASYESQPAVVVDRSRQRAMRRNEAMVILSSCGSVLCSEFGALELEDMEDSVLEEWFMKACREFRIKTGRDASVSTRPLAMEAA